VRRSMLSVAIAGLALTVAGPGFSQINTGGITPTQRATFNLAEAYPATSGTFTGSLPWPIAPNGCWNPSLPGFSEASPTVQAPTLDLRCSATVNPTLAGVPAQGRTGFAVGGILCLPTAGDLLNPRLNVNAFVTLAAGDSPNRPAFVQMVRLTKEIPGSIKCPDVFGTPVLDANGQRTGQPAQRFTQFGATPSGIRTWWALSYTQPGTKFNLDVTVVAQKPVGNTGFFQPSLHVDRFTWVVVANADTLPVTINLLHTNTIGTMEIPCIVSEDAFCDFMAAAGLIKQADSLLVTDPNRDEARFQAIQTFEGLIFQFAAFTDFVTPEQLFPVIPATQPPTFQPPSDHGDIPGSSGSVGVIDSLENPCLCKMLVDVERIAEDWGIAL
jgi:hypothetical protein